MATAVRRALMWWLAPPANPYVTVNAAVDFHAARQWLDQANRTRDVPFTVHHLVTACVARVLHEFPIANARIVRGRIVHPPHVGMAMPVSLLGHEGGQTRELGLMLLQEAETKSLDAIARELRQAVRTERKGRAHNPVIRALVRLAEASPQGSLEAVLEVLDRARRSSATHERTFRLAPVTTAVTNPGAGFGDIGASLFRGAGFQLPDRLVHIGTFWGLSFVQDEVVAVEGRIEVRSMLPVMLVFDHRLFDGVMAGRILRRLVELLQDPSAVFGPDGTKAPQSHSASVA